MTASEKILREYFLFETHLHTNDSSLCARASAWQWSDFFKLNFPWIEDLILTNHSHSPGLYDSRIMAGKVLHNDYTTIKHPRVYAGLEVNILANGNIDVDDGVIKNTDWVTAALNPLRVEYGEMKYSKQDANMVTKNYLKLIRSGKVDVIGHPTANIDPNIQENIDWKSVFTLAKKSGVMIELNLLEELDEWWLKKLIDSECMITLGSDWHGFYHFRRFKPSAFKDRSEEEVWEKVVKNGRRGFDSLGTDEKEVYNDVYLRSPLGGQLYDWHSSELVKAINLGLKREGVFNSRGRPFLTDFIKSSNSKRRILVSQL